MFLAVVILPEDPNERPNLHLIEMDSSLDEFSLRLDDGLALVGVVDCVPPVIVVGPETEREAEWVLVTDESRTNAAANWQ